MKCDYFEALYIEMHVHASNLNTHGHFQLHTMFLVKVYYIGYHLIWLAIQSHEDLNFESKIGIEIQRSESEDSCF